MSVFKTRVNLWIQKSYNNGTDIDELNRKVASLQKRNFTNECILNALMEHLGVEAERISEHTEVHLKDLYQNEQD